LEFLSKYEFEIKHVKGKGNQLDDALSGISHEMHIASISMYNIGLKDRISRATNSNQQYLKIKETLQQDKLQ